MENTTSLSQPLSISSYDLHRTGEAAQFSQKLKLVRNSPFKITDTPTDVLFELLTHDVLQTNNNSLTPFYRRELLLFPRTNSYFDRNSIFSDNSDTSDMVDNDHYTSTDNVNNIDFVFDVDTSLRFGRYFN